MKESKVISISPKDEQYMIDSYQKFGWEVLTFQEIFSQDSHEEADGDKNVSVTNTVNFVKIVFSRDTNMPNYDKIVELEKKFEQISMPVLKRESTVFDKLKYACTAVAAIFLIAIIAWIAVKLLDSFLPLPFAEWFSLHGLIFCVIIFAAALVVGEKLLNIKVKEIDETAKGIYEAELQLARQQQAAILEEVKQYVK